jgi:hypothetical protein
MNYDTVLAAAAQPSPPSNTLFYLLALAVAGPFVLYWFHRLGDTIPLLLGLAAAVFIIWVVPTIPNSPISCIQHNTCTDQQSPALPDLVILVPLFVVLGTIAVRGYLRRAYRRQ